MLFYLGVTDNDWFATLRRYQCSECNFWVPSGRGFDALSPGQEFLFKLKSPYNHIGGGGRFVRSEQLSLQIAWNVFGISNGCTSFDELSEKILGYRAKQDSLNETDPTITCVVIEDAVYFRDSDLIPAPSDWANSIVTGKRHDTSNPLHNALWQQYVAARNNA